MDEDGPSGLSRQLIRRYRKNEARLDGHVRAGIDPKAYAKLDRVLQRELGLAQREQVLDTLWGETPAAPKSLRVIAAMRMPKPSPIPAFRGRALRKRDLIRRNRTAGQMALARMMPDFQAMPEVEIVTSHWLTRSVVVNVPISALGEIADRGDVRQIAHDKRMIALALDVSRPLIRADEVENVLGVTGRDVDVAVCDTGVDFTHAALAPVMGNQLDFTGEGTGDLHGHGTHCAGVVASNDRVRRGVAPGCTVHDYKLMDANGSAQPSNCISAIQQAVTDNMDVLSNSWGFSHANGVWVCPDGTCVLCAAAEAAVESGVVVVVAAGNEDNDTCSTYDTHIRCPGHATNVITVAASDDSDAMANFSSIGPAADGRAKPDVTAPGVDIVSARSSTGSDMNGGATVVDGVWLESSGTSMACPHVAGLAALMLDRNGGLSPAQVKAVVMSTAVNIGATADEMGAGRVDAMAAVSSV